MAYDAKVLLDSVTRHGERLTTFEVTFPRFILAEWNTHRVQSRNSASSRAIPVERRLSMIADDPFVPLAFGSKNKGMQPGADLEGEDEIRARTIWLTAKDKAVVSARAMAECGVHKEIANRIVEPYAWHTVVASGTEWANFFGLRLHKNAAQALRHVVEMMRDVFAPSTPVERGDGDWHLPFIRPEEPWGAERSLNATDGARISAGRCARVSYLTHDGRRDAEADVGLADKLLYDGHMSPLEHPARPMTDEERWHFAHPEYVWNAALQRFAPTGRVRHFLGNIDGWVQYRKMIPGEAVFIARD